MRVALYAALAHTVAGNAAIDKIVSMLKDMEKMGKKDKQTEKVQFAAFNEWCSNTQAEKKADIEASTEAISRFEAAVENGRAKAAEAEENISDAQSVIESNKKDIVGLKKVRQEEKKVFFKEKTDLNDSIYACEKAMEQLSAVPEKAEAAKLFLQMKQSSKSSARWEAVQSLLETVQKAENPFTSASERKSNVVIEMLEKLKDEFSTELQTKTKDESAAQHSYDLALQEATQNIEANERIVKEQTATKGEAESDAGKAKKDLEQEEQSKADDEKYLGETVQVCTEKAKDFEGRQKSRTDELTAIAEAISILTSAEVQKGAGHLDEAQKVSMFIQLREKQPSATAQERVVAFLRQRASSIHSSTLMQLAEMAGADPFVKIRKMIQELVTRLEEEAQAELTKKGKCDKDIAENKAKLEEFTTLVEKLESEIETLTSEVSDATKTKKRLTNEIEENKKATAEAKKDRLAEKIENEKVISESKAALDALDQALSVLQNYYSTVKGSLIQTKSKQPSFEGGEYKGMGGEGGIMGMLEVVKSQTDQMIRETESAESAAASAHSEFMTESEMSLEKKKSLLRSTEVTLANKKEDLTDKKDALEGEEGAKVQLAAYQKEKAEVIDPVCTVQGVSFEERHKKREEEIQSLTEAMEILNQMAG